jgi:MFS family permease
MKFFSHRIHHKYLIETLVFSSYVLFAMAWVGGTASMNQIMLTMHINSLASASFISGAVTLAKIVGTFLAAWLALKLGIKNAFLLAGLFVSVGIITPISPNYEWLLFSRFLMGLGGAFMIVYFNPIVMSCFTPAERPTINGLNAVAFNVGTGIVLWKMTAINNLTGSWQNTLILFSLLTIALCGLWYFVKLPQAQTSANSKSQNTSSGLYLKGLTNKFNWQYSLTYSGILAFYICLFTFYPKAGISQSSLVIASGIIGTLAGIIYSKKYPLRLPVIRWSGLIIVLAVIGLSFTNSVWLQTLSAITLGFFIFFPITALVSIPHELAEMTEQKITVVFSLFYSISYLIATLVLWGFGKLVDINNGDYSSAFILISLLSSTFFIGSFFLPESGKHVKTSLKQGEDSCEA